MNWVDWRGWARSFRSFGQSRLARHFISHNRRIFPARGNVAKGDAIVLMELNDMASAHIAYSYLANSLADRCAGEVWAYYPRTLNESTQRVLFWLRAKLGSRFFGVYSSFGISNFIAIRPTSKQRARAGDLVAELLPQLQSKTDLEAIHINGVWVGDLIYDTYLRRFNRPTVDIQSVEFREFFQESIELFVWWEDFFGSHDVRGVSVSHCVYNLAMPLRIAVERGIPAFQAGLTHVYRLNKDNYFAYNDFHYFPERFSELSGSVQAEGLAEAKRRIERRFAGEVGVDMSYSSKSAYGAPRHDELLKPSPRKKILIATHCFFDSPHSYGKNVFPDFYEWIQFLGEISNQTDYDWYIKTHPDYLPGTKEIIDDFIARFPRFVLLPSNASHLQIINEGIDFALTVYGTIGFEYAALGIPVINNSPNNPHIAYDFNIHTKNVTEYREALMSMDSLDFQIDKQQVYQYYFMRNVFNTNDLFFDDFDKVVDKIGGYEQQFFPDIYREWLDVWTPEKHAEIKAGLTAFIDSQDFRMDYRHLGREFALKTVEDVA